MRGYAALKLASLSLLAMPFSAYAADLPVKAPPPVVVAAYNWTGCYAGANAGWKWGDFSDSASAPTTTGAIDGLGTFTAPASTVNLGSGSASGGAYGGQIGCRWQTPGNWVFGFEGDFDGTSLSRTFTARAAGISAGNISFVPGDNFVNRLNWESSIRGVVGYAWDRFLVYGTGGVAFGGVKMTGNFIPTVGTFTNGAAGLYPASSGSESQTLVGWTLGAGVAYALSRDWDIGAEYRYTSYGSGNFNLGTVSAICSPALACLNQNVTGNKDLQTSEVLFKLNYHFNWGAPIVARY